MEAPTQPTIQGATIIAEGVTIGIARQQGTGVDHLMIGPITLLIPLNEAVKKAIVEGLTKVQIVAAHEMPKQ